MLCAATGGVVSACRSSDAPGGGTERLLTGFRPVSRDSQPPALELGSGKERAPVSSASCCTTDSDSASAGCLASGTGFVIFWITNLWRGERLDDTRESRRGNAPMQSKRASAGEGGNFRQDIDEAQRRHWKRVAAGQDYEVRYEAKKTGKSKGEVKRAVKRVGPSWKKVEKTLRRKK
jgi:hypothetical protein